MYSSEHPTAYVYVRVHNRGKEKFDGKNKWVALYWAKASTGISQNVWKGRETDENGELTGKTLMSFLSDQLNLVNIKTWNLDGSCPKISALTIV